jgi:sulfocyanin
MRIHAPWRLAGVLALGLSVLIGTGQVSAKAPTWITTSGKTVTVTLIAAYNNTASGFNFNGEANGKMTITVPLGYIVHVTFSNNAPLPHSAEIVGFTKAIATAKFSPVFKGASSPNPTATGTVKGKTDRFSFAANKAGNYLLVCAIPGHAAAGMWDNFVVSKSAKTGSVVLK